MISKILFVTLSNIGDAILTLPVLDTLKVNFPDAQVTVVVGPRPAGIFEDNPCVSRVIVYDKHAPFSAKWKLLGLLQQEKFDVIVDLRNSFFGLLLRAPYKTSVFSRIPAHIRHMRSRHINRISALAQILPRSRLELLHRSLPSYQTDWKYIDGLLKDAKVSEQDPLIVVAAGARSEIKRWPKEQFVELIRRLTGEFKAKVVLIGDNDDALGNGYIAGHTEAADFTGKTTLFQAGVLLKRARLLITNDSANLHLASYLDVPVVAVFGPTDQDKYGPWSKGSVAVSKEIVCRPCMKAQCRFKTVECMQRIRVDAVLSAVRQVLTGAASHPAQSVQYRRILIVRTDRIGDVVLSTPVIKALRDALPNASIAMLVRPYTRVAVEGNPYLDEVILYDKAGKEKGWLGTVRFCRRLARKRFDLAVVLNPSHRSNLIPFLAGIPRRVGYDRKMGWLLTDRIPDTKHQGLKHEIEYNLDLVRYLGIMPGESRTYVPVDSASEEWADEILAREKVAPGDRVAVLNPGASEASKQWPPKNYAAVADALARKGFRIAVLGGKQDAQVCWEVIGAMHYPAINLAANNTISQAAAFLRHARLFISCDTGPMHIASSVGTPVVCVMGRNQPGLNAVRWGPHHSKSIVLHKDIGCVPCLAHDCKKNFQCLAAITPEEVVLACEKLVGP